MHDIASSLETSGRAHGRLAVITGGGRGIGRAITLRLARDGWRCIIAGLDDDDLKSTAVDAEPWSQLVSIVACDIAAAEGRAMLTQTWEKDSGGRLDLLVNCAAQCTPMPLFDQPAHAWAAELETNLVAVALLSAWAIEQMRPRRTGAVVNVGSVYGALGLNAQFYPDVYPQTGSAGPVRAPAYHASKGGVAALTRELAVAAGPWNIRVNTISPGMINTPERIFSDQRVAKFARATPLRRMGNPDEVARVVEFLASEASAFMTGSEVVVDGGWSIW